MGMGSGGGTQQVIQSQNIPKYQSDYAIENQDVARDIAARPFPAYQGQRTADFSQLQQQGLSQVAQNATNTPNFAAYDQGIGAAAGNTGSSYGPNVISPGSYFDVSQFAAPAHAGRTGVPTQVGALAAPGSFGQSLDPGSIAPWMSPFVEQALRPQLNAIDRQGAATSRGINAGAASAGAFGDARTGVQQGENDRNTAELRGNTIGTGYQNAFDRAVAASQSAFGANAGQFNTETAARLANYDANRQAIGQNNAAGLAAFDANRQAIGQNNAADMAVMSGRLSATGQNNDLQLKNFMANAGQFNTDRTANLAAADELARLLGAKYGYAQQTSNDLLSAGDLQQKHDQGDLTTAYQDFLNQFEYPQEMLNLRLATQAGSPYNTTRLTTTPYSPTAQGIGALSALYGLVGRPAGATG